MAANISDEEHDEYSVPSLFGLEGPPEIPMTTVSVSYAKQVFDFDFHSDATLQDLVEEIEATIDIPIQNQKLIVPKKPLIKAPLKNPEMPLTELTGKKILLMGSSALQVDSVQTMVEKVAKRNAARLAQGSKKRRAPPPRTIGSQYDFLQVKPLQGLPHPERSLHLLMRLKNDPGIKAAMKKHEFVVGLLTEMEPVSNTQTTHEGTTRLLGLNRNRGEVIELRLRTDAHDGYRDYKTIRKTLCHELAHNVHGPHDRKFWDLCHQIEREVEAADWKSSGHTLGETSRYAISGQEEDHEDEGGWEGGEYVLGGVKNDSTGMSRREIIAQATATRMRLQMDHQNRVKEGSGIQKRREGSPSRKERK